MCIRDSNRATFYKHYRDPLDLLEKIEEEMLQYLQETLEHDACRNITSLYTTVLTKIQENGALYRTCLLYTSNQSWQYCYTAPEPGSAAWPDHPEGEP